MAKVRVACRLSDSGHPWTGLLIPAVVQLSWRRRNKVIMPTDKRIKRVDLSPVPCLIAPQDVLEKEYERPEQVQKPFSHEPVSGDESSDYVS